MIFKFVNPAHCLFVAYALDDFVYAKSAAAACKA